MLDFSYTKGAIMTVRVRFAPSPTGHLHIGGARTALFNYLFAKNKNGKFILRIEDTDSERGAEEFRVSILDGIHWLGMDYDEGPFYQSKRMDLYKSHVQKLLDEGKAYRCYCTPDELAQRREEALKQGKDAKYDRRCRDITENIEKPFAIRIKAPIEGTTSYHDICRGTITVDNRELDDLIIARSDGSPTYNLTVVVDDVDMKITHIIRGDDHINNTLRQIVIYKAMDFELPEFAHLPMIHGPDKKKLSKRHGAVSVIEYQKQGFLPEAMINYLARLGWAYGDQEIFTKNELIKHFDLSQVGKAASVFDVEKLSWVNSQHILKYSATDLAKLTTPFLEYLGINVPVTDFTEKAIFSVRERGRTLAELAEKSAFYFKDKVEFDEKSVNKWLNEKGKANLKKIRDGLEEIDNFTEENIGAVFNSIMNETGEKMLKLAQPCRVAITGCTASPSIYEVINILGKEEVLKRFDKTLTL